MAKVTKKVESSKVEESKVAENTAKVVENATNVTELKNVSFREGDKLTTLNNQTLVIVSIESRKATKQSALYHVTIDGEERALTSTQIKQKCGFIVGNGGVRNARATKIEDIPSLYSDYCKAIETARNELEERICELTAKINKKAENIANKYGVTFNGFVCVDSDEFTKVQTERIEKAQAENVTNRAERKADKLAESLSDAEKVALLIKLGVNPELLQAV